MTLLDVDDETRLGWNAKGATPHAALAELAQLAANGGAKAVLVDFDLSMDRPDMTADPALLNFLQNYKSDAPLLMLVRKIGFVKMAGSDGRAPVMAAIASSTPYDAAASGKPNVRWVTTLNDIGSDRVVWRIKLWQSVCDGMAGIAYPSAALLTAGYFADHGKHGAEVEQFLNGRAAVDCGSGSNDRATWPNVQRQAVHLPYVFAGGSTAKVLLRIDTPKGPVVALRRISAGHMVNFADGKAAAAGDIDRDPFEGRVAIVGASYTESTDVHETPLGTMPGSMVIANSIVQAERMVSVVAAPAMVRNVLALILFLIFAVFARHLIGLAAIFGIGIVSMCTLVLCSRIYGVESGFEVVAAAITGFSLFKLIDSSVQMAMDIPKRRWRAIFK